MFDNFIINERFYGVCAAPAKIIETELGKLKSAEGVHRFTSEGAGVLKCTKCGIIQANMDKRHNSK